jgi:hypothetical protein
MFWISRRNTVVKQLKVETRITSHEVPGRERGRIGDGLICAVFIKSQRKQITQVRPSLYSPQPRLRFKPDLGRLLKRFSHVLWFVLHGGRMRGLTYARALSHNHRC